MGSNPILSSKLPLRITVSTHGFGPCGSGSIPLGVTKIKFLGVDQLVDGMLWEHEAGGSSPPT